MTDQNYPITLPPVLLEGWKKAWHHSKVKHIGLEEHIVTQTAQWAADQELEACCKWLPKLPPWSADDLRRHRRPKPPSLKEQALAAQQRIWDGTSNHDDWNLIRRALEALND